ncbi:hypothetical protein EGQ24_01255 [bacterium]|nr:hypothetical protein [bacterium]
MGYGFNTMNNGWMSMLQQGLSSFGVGTNSWGSLGTIGYNVNYDSMAGYAVANSVFGVLSQAISTSQAEKQAEKVQYSNNARRIEQIDKQIKELENTDMNDEVETRSKTDSGVKAKQTAFDKASQSLTKNEEYLKNESGNYAAALEREKAGTATEADKKLISEYKKAEENTKTLGKEKNEAQTDLDNAKDALRTKIENEIKGEIADLKAEKAKLQEEVDNQDLDNADGNKLSRLSDEKYENLLGKDGLAKKNEKYSKAAVKTAVNRFMQATAPETKLKTAKNLVTMFEGCSDWNESLQKAANIAQRYINEHKA